MNGKNPNEYFMERCIQLALKGKSNVAPNPMVGSVIVHNGIIIGEGYHIKYGEAHAEVNAINSVTDKSLLAQSTIYVSLEPCSHTGKTPPCADLIIHHKIPHVVIGMSDPFAKVNGRGIQKLIDAGCNVEVGVLEKECKELNKTFITFHTQKRPWAQTLDGFIDKVREPGDIQQPNWITNEVCRSLVHKWRTEEPAFMVGANTALNDNPRLTVRDWAGRNPIRILADKDLSLPLNLHIFDNEAQSLVFNQVKDVKIGNIENIKINFEADLVEQILTKLYHLEIQSIVIEGGRKLLEQFITKNLWDEARIFTGNKYFYKGTKAPDFQAFQVSENLVGDCWLRVYRNNF